MCAVHLYERFVGLCRVADTAQQRAVTLESRLLQVSKESSPALRMFFAAPVNTPDPPLLATHLLICRSRSVVLVHLRRQDFPSCTPDCSVEQLAAISPGDRLCSCNRARVAHGAAQENRVRRKEADDLQRAVHLAPPCVAVNPAAFIFSVYLNAESDVHGM